MREFFRILGWIILITLAIISNLEAKEGDFWRSQDLEDWGWKVIDQGFSHIIYQDSDEQLWTICHSGGDFIKLEEAHKVIIDERKNTIERLNWYHRSLKQKIIDWIKGKKIPMISMLDNPNGGRILDYEELYYCHDCFCSFNDCK